MLELAAALGRRYCFRLMTKQTTPKHGITPPKGHPTRARDNVPPDKRVFGPASQWTAFVVLAIVLFVMLVILTNGSDSSPITNTGQIGSIVASLALAT